MNDARARHHPPTIGVLSPLLGDEFYGNVLLGIHHTARKEGARAFAIQTWPQWRQGHEWIGGSDPTTFVPYALDHVDAVISLLRAVKPEDLRKIQESGKPIVTVCTHLPDLGIPAIYPDNFAGVTALVHHLAEHGHTRIGFVGCMRNDDVIERYDAYKAALRDLGIPEDPGLLFEAPNLLESGGIPVAEALLAAGMPCTAVFVATDENALGIIARIQAAGYQVPRDLAVAAFDDVERSAVSAPSLTTIHQNNVDLGTIAAGVVLAILAGKPVPTERIFVPARPVYRQSCGCWTFAKTRPAHTGSGAGSGDRVERFQQAMLGEMAGDAGTETARDLAPLFKGACEIARALGDVLDGGPLPAPGALSMAWRAVCAGSTSLEAVSRAFGALQVAVEEAVPADAADPAVAARVRDLLAEMRTELLYATRYTVSGRARDFETINSLNYKTGLTLSALHEASVHDLSWLAETLASSGCLGLWQHAAAGSRLSIAGVYQKDAQTVHKLGDVCSVSAFPPMTVFETMLEAHPDQLLMVLPLQTIDQDWGALALLSPPEIQALTSDTGVWQWTAPLMAAMARERLASEREHLLLLLQESEQRRAQMALERERSEKEVYKSAAARLEELNHQLGETNRLKTALLEQSRAQATAAEELARLRSDFVATVSHELRTPLTAIVGYAELLETRWTLIEEAQRLDQIHRIVTAAHRQQRLVEELLLLSRLEMGALVPNTGPVAIAGLVERAADEVRTSYRDQRIDIAGPAGLAAVADSDRTLQVLVNLMDNAAKYSPEGSPIHVYWESAGSRVVVRVQDHGAGVPIAGRDQLFTRFGRVPGSHTRAGRVGTGLGLYLGRQFARAMGGDLELESSGPTGSVFRLFLPIALPVAQSG